MFWGGAGGKIGMFLHRTNNSFVCQNNNNKDNNNKNKGVRLIYNAGPSFWSQTLRRVNRKSLKTENTVNIAITDYFYALKKKKKLRKVQDKLAIVALSMFMLTVFDNACLKKAKKKGNYIGIWACYKVYRCWILKTAHKTSSSSGGHWSAKRKIQNWLWANMFLYQEPFHHPAHTTNWRLPFTLW